ncbi:type VII secretion-associated serine protease mycosin [Micromonospora sp. WMMD1102]|uniref:type VII secretion-associated serine protease mycosin n=1 Tax=Micromonospora sp. WMMD1102 TaxID=3016105 RepID=UPI0024155CF5|nr:type VII secretion-associated serine protease mycosin [Micromonospora sp. WMMD1102]MDG4786545.1 type VII secretion-associated serine protease mycosin [Micromonospora sp. WMMD1102]
MRADPDARRTRRTAAGAAPGRPAPLPARRTASVLAALLAGLIATAGGPAAASPPHRYAAARCGPAVTDPLAAAPWPLTRLRPDLAWPLSTGVGIRVAVVDSGVSADHPTLAGKVLPGRDLLSDSDGDGRCDENGHGTLIAGIIAGREAVSAGFRFYGVAPGAEIVPVRVLRDQRRSEEADLSGRIAEAIRWAVDEAGADVVNLSLTTPPTRQLQSAVAHALDRRVVVVAAAGNAGESNAQAGQPTFPAAYPGVLAVAGVNAADAHVQTSTSGDFVDVAAPGERIAGPAVAGGGYLFTAEGGTSFAAGYVSGLAALIRAYDPTLSPEQVADRITQTADHPDGLWNSQVGHGVVNPVRAVGALRPAGAAEPGAAVSVPRPAARPGPLGAVSAVSGVVAVIGVALAALLLASVPVVRRGRRRGWRTARK